MQQPTPGVPLSVSVDLLESAFVHEGRGSRVSREQFMMVLSHIRVLHIRASYYSTVSRVRYVYVINYTLVAARTHSVGYKPHQENS